MFKAEFLKKSNPNDPLARLLKFSQERSVYVGIPAGSSRDRKKTLHELAGKVTGNSKKSRTKKERILASATQDVNNAELLFIQSKGSMARGIPARPVLEPAINADGNREVIVRELIGASKAAANGDAQGAEQGLKRTGIAAQNAARKWITDPRNGFAPNAPSTIKQKGSDRPLIDQGVMRAAITYVIE